ncbi:hypothetical protein RBB50_012878 [Rhinocladiella similis]
MVVKIRHESFYLDIRGQRIFVEVDGGGPYMIMTHGLGASSNVFQPLTEIFSGNYTVVRFDWPGLGMTGLTPGHAPLSVPGFLADLEGVMEYLKIEKAVLVGHSLGGIISMHFAAKHPTRVTALVAIGAGRTRTIEGPSRTATLAGAKSAREIGVWPVVDDKVHLNIPPSSPALARALLRQMTSSTDPEGYAQVCDSLTDVSHVDPDYSRITSPTCVVGSHHDNIAPAEVAQELAELIGKSGRKPYLKLLNTGHMQIIEDVDGVTEAIRTVLPTGNGV